MPSQQVEQDLALRLWEHARPLLPEYTPSPKGGRPRIDDWACFLGIVHVLRSGCRWQDLPDTLPSPSTCWRRHAEWTNDGVWERVWTAVIEELDAAGCLDTSELFLDASFVEARKGGSRLAALSAARG
jgi:transposase